MEEQTDVLIVADENIPYAAEAFGELGEVRTLPGRSMDTGSVRDAELLLVRSVTEVNDRLIEGRRVRFVGTATIGTDHVDEPALAERGIRFVSAPGSNADSVAEYVVAALLVLAERRRIELAGRSIGIIGVGNVGSRVEARCRALGMKPVLNDPPLERKTNDRRYRPLDELFDCDVISLHVPLERGGSDPSWHLADRSFLMRMRSDGILINTARGAVVCNEALLHTLKSGRPGDAVLDVWEGEPDIHLDLLEHTALATPHIAGYSFDGKVRATEMLYRAACEFLRVEPTWDAASVLPPPEHPELCLDADSDTTENLVRQAVLTVYPIERDDAALRAIRRQPESERAAFFDRLRKEYPVRREFRNTRVLVGGSPARAELLQRALSGIGFQTERIA